MSDLIFLGFIVQDTQKTSAWSEYVIGRFTIPTLRNLLRASEFAGDARYTKEAALTPRSAPLQVKELNVHDAQELGYTFQQKFDPHAHPWGLMMLDGKFCLRFDSLSFFFLW